LLHDQVGLRPIRWRDAPVWTELRRRNSDWLRPWEATPPFGGWEYRDSPSTFFAMVRQLHRQARTGSSAPFAVLFRGEFVGQLTVGNIVRGSLNGGHLSYWLDQRVAGRGIMPTAVALVVDHCFGDLRLHRLEVNVRPENMASRRVMEKLRFREEGLRSRYLHIAGSYRDHLCYAITPEDVPEGLLARWTGGRRAG
jgi:ribosomal-protein-alanine N-acetyltransferase